VGAVTLVDDALIPHFNQPIVVDDIRNLLSNVIH
jgi:hypothetical protein